MDEARGIEGLHKSFVRPLDPGRTPEGLVSVDSLRDTIARAGFDMAGLGGPLAIIDEHFSGQRDLTDLSATTLERVLPKQLVTSFGKLSGPQRDNARETYEQLDTVVSSNHTIAFRLLYDQVLTSESGINLEGCTTRSAVMHNVFQYLAGGGTVQEATRVALSQYTEYSWGLVLIHHRFILRKVQGIGERLESYGLEIPREDIFQQGLLSAYKVALGFDGTQGKFTTYAGRYLDVRVVQGILGDESISYRDVTDYLDSQHNARHLLRGTLFEGEPNDVDMLTALLYYKKQGLVTYEDQEVLHALVEFQRMNAEKGYRPPSDVLSVHLQQPLRPLVRKFLGRLDKLNQWQRVESLDEERVVQYWGESGEIEHAPVDRHEYRPAGESFRPVEDEALGRENQHTLRDLLEPMIDELHDVSERDKAILKYRYGFTGGQGKKLREVGQEFGITPERVRQIEDRLLRKLRHPTSSIKLRDFSKRVD